MSTQIICAILLGVAIGLLIAIFITKFTSKIKTVGNLVIIDDPDDGSYLFLELSGSNISSIRSERFVQMNVVNRDINLPK